MILSKNTFMDKPTVNKSSNPTQHQTGFVLSRAMVLFTSFFVPILFVGTIVSYYLPRNPNGVMISLICGGICYSSCAIALSVTYWYQSRYGMSQADILLGTFLRTGIPAVAALVLFGAFDNNISNRAILTLTTYYLLALACEAMLTIPRCPPPCCSSKEATAGNEIPSLTGDKPVSPSEKDWD